MAPAPITTQDSDTVIFLDVDGVLNIGIHDEGNAPLLLRDEDVKTAVKLAKRGYKGPEAHCVAKLSALSQHPIGQMEDATYEKLMTLSGAEVSDVLVQRLAAIMEAAGESCQVVLSSSWRRQHHRSRRQTLERCISKHLGKAFHFSETTPVTREEKCAADRLLTVGEYLKDLCTRRPLDAPELRVLVLEDFFITAMDGWSCEGRRMESVVAAEQWLEDKAASKGSISVKLVHCYEEITTESGLKMQVGRGLTQKSFEEAKEFVTSIMPASFEKGQGEETPPFPPTTASPKKETGFLQMLSSWASPSVVRAF
mmetsp:Transcript_82594/g.145722  ORF Transcript_82594/g.145722 Transcript_82594/m.145722 type:complete len:311 (+) Transcript_82594:109-1041(+)|eukprot:CAMPEP_0197639556 /NCGR_PEP_ID=MMETSP1338-20131121/14147_1 /TAXON_ID=43686 ORGANISM="Pelagodinium beii, Strain RCC1491" /NCGR_SAMPLE_ID=MMETSP1338 /ASSEMBLY_ACC=CAM_ASM_000754 /LENGTH=310 /DNA_ID=CAMNT_0043212299 /DNA_START=106 /DNA_END=1038 /DNA_ORIENTATION=-